MTKGRREETASEHAQRISFFEQPFEVNEEISRAFSEEDLKTSKVLNDFQVFLNYISENNGMKLTVANSFISRKHVFALNELMSNPEELRSTVNQPDSITIHLFYSISRTLGLFVVSATNTLEITPRMDNFKMLSPKEHFVVLFDAMWNGTRADVASLFSKCEPGKTYLFEDQLKQSVTERADTEDEFCRCYTTAIFYLSVFVERIMPVLKLFGLLDFGYAKDRDEYQVRHGLGIECFTITQLGKKIFKTLAGE